MIAAWMLYCTVVGLLFVGAGHLAERVVLARGGPTRRVWAFALFGAIALPALAIVLRDDPIVPFESGVGVVSSVGTLAMAESVDLLSVFDGLLLRGWAAASVVLALLLAAALVDVARRARAWLRDEVDGVPVLVSENVGPAVVGVLRSRIVLPRWAVTAGEQERALLLRHEQEHVAAGDPRLILLAALVVIAMPWNVALWRMALRLRAAVEVDCDRRVVGRAGVDAVRRYGALLLTAGRRRGPAAAVALGFSRSRSLLELRIDRMTLRRRQGVVAAFGSAMVVVGILAAAWAIPQPVRAADVPGWFTPCPDAQAPSTRTASSGRTAA